MGNNAETKKHFQANVKLKALSGRHGLRLRPEL